MKTLTLSIACGLALITATSAWASEPPRVGRSRRQIRAQGMLRSAASVAPGHRPAAAGRINAIQRGAIARYRQRFGAEVGLDGVDGEMPNAALSSVARSSGTWIGYEGVDGERPLPLSVRRALIRRSLAGYEGVILRVDKTEAIGWLSGRIGRGDRVDVGAVVRSRKGLVQPFQGNRKVPEFLHQLVAKCHDTDN